MDVFEPIESREDDGIEAFFNRFDELMAEDPAAALTWLENAPETIRNESAWVLGKAEALRASRDAATAAGFLERVLADVPEFADAHHLLAGFYEELGRTKATIAHQLETLNLDNLVDSVSEPPSPQLMERMIEAAGAALTELPPELRARLANLAILLEPRPSVSLVSSGFDARALGLFEGPSLPEMDAGEHDVMPASITLFTHCLLDAFGQDEDELCRQVRVTVLHEIGHYFGLDEERVAAMGLG